jgi:hypothetical protein
MATHANTTDNSVPQGGGAVMTQLGEAQASEKRVELLAQIEERLREEFHKLDSLQWPLSYLADLHDDRENPLLFRMLSATVEGIKDRLLATADEFQLVEAALTATIPSPFLAPPGNWRGFLLRAALQSRPSELPPFGGCQNTRAPGHWTPRTRPRLWRL